jgi:hypothetical protein
MLCHKEKFDKKTAKTILNKCKKEHRPEIRIYECPECNAWHLTSEEEYEERIYLTEEDLIFKSKWEELKKP